MSHAGKKKKQKPGAETANHTNALGTLAHTHLKNKSNRKTFFAS